MNNAPHRPEHVPPEAVWLEADNEWELGTTKDGKKVGKWQWWLAPTYHLCCETYYNDDGEIVSYTRYHPDGTWSRKGTYKNGKEHGLTQCQRSHGETGEFFPPNAPSDAWRSQTTFVDGTIHEEKYFDEDDDPTGNHFKDGVWFDEDGDRIEDEEDDINQEEATQEPALVQVSFNSVEDASKRWNEEGLRFKNDLNAWLDIIYKEDKQPDTPEPQETRADMAEYVVERIKEFNKRGETEKLREMFHPAFEPFLPLYDRLSKSITQLYILQDGRIAIRAEIPWQDVQVYLIDDKTITQQPDILAIGASRDRRYIAKAYEDRIDICEGWDGTIIKSFAYPKDYKDDLAGVHPDKNWADIFEYKVFSLVSIEVFPDASRILLTSRYGIYVLDEEGSRLIHPTSDTLFERYKSFAEDYQDEEPDKPFKLDLEYVHATISPDGRYIACGDQDSVHRILHEQDGRWEEAAQIEPRSSYPNCARFHDQEPHVALSSCHFSRSATIGVDLNLLPGLEASAWDADEHLHYIDERFWIFSIVPVNKGYLLGDNNGYIWWKAYQGLQQFGYLHLGSTTLVMDTVKNPDGSRTLVIGNFAGQVIKLRTRENEPHDPHLITNIPIWEEKRWLFWQGSEPMVW
ncbi:hypothetical protein JXM67_00495 [candidate division WOR-3 bacterium]|nr:hypothetical protein [candidate division WOR-3 bacterium]